MIARNQRKQMTCSLLVGMSKCIDSLENNFAIYSKTKNAVSIWCSNCTLGHLSLRYKMYAHEETCIRMSGAVLFVLAKIGKQPRCLSISQCLNKQWYIKSNNTHLSRF